MTRLLIATRNEHVFNRLRELIDDVDIEIFSSSEAETEVPTASGTTYDQSAMEIADKAAKASGFVTIAEVSGIEVAALDGAPGVSSDIFAGSGASDEENRQELLRDLHDSGYQTRSARLVTYIGVAHPDGRLQAFGSSVEGMIANEERGIEGDGYEPIFQLDDGLTIAELLPDARDRVHPRATALAEARPFLYELLGKDVP